MDQSKSEGSGGAGGVSKDSSEVKKGRTLSKLPDHEIFYCSSDSEQDPDSDYEKHYTDGITRYVNEAGILSSRLRKKPSSKRQASAKKENADNQTTATLRPKKDWDGEKYEWALNRFAGVFHREQWFEEMEERAKQEEENLRAQIAAGIPEDDDVVDFDALSEPADNENDEEEDDEYEQDSNVGMESPGEDDDGQSEVSVVISEAGQEENRTIDEALEAGLPAASASKKRKISDDEEYYGASDKQLKRPAH